MRLQNRTIIVTGSGRNIGEGIARTLADEGVRVAVVDIIRERTEAIAGAINAAHDAAALPIACDVTDSADVQAMVARVADTWGDIYALVNNVGVVDRKDILETDEAEWDRVINISLKSVFLVSKYVAQRMVDQGSGGRIINIGSTSGLAGRSNAVAYPSAKAGVYNLTRSPSSLPRTASGSTPSLPTAYAPRPSRARPREASKLPTSWAGRGRRRMLRASSPSSPPTKRISSPVPTSPWTAASAPDRSDGGSGGPVRSVMKRVCVVGKGRLELPRRLGT